MLKKVKVTHIAIKTVGWYSRSLEVDSTIFGSILKHGNFKKKFSNQIKRTTSVEIKFTDEGLIENMPEYSVWIIKSFRWERNKKVVWLKIKYGDLAFSEKILQFLYETYTNINHTYVYTSCSRYIFHRVFDKVCKLYIDLSLMTSNNLL